MVLPERRPIASDGTRSRSEAIEKQPACAAATSSSGFVQGASSNRIENV